MARPAKGTPPRHEKILQAASELFYTKGFAGVGVDEIGARAGVTGPAIYRHFSGKDEILATLFDQGLDGLISVTVGELDDPAATLRHHIGAHAAYALRERRIVAVLIHEGRSLADPYRRRLERRERQYVEHLATRVAACHPTASKADVMAATWTAVATLNLSAVSPRDVVSHDRSADLIAAFVLSGLESLSASAAPVARGARSRAKAAS